CEYSAVQLGTEFIQLPLAFDAARLMDEIAQFDESEWHGLPLVCERGDPSSAQVKGPMRPTPHLMRCTYMQEVLASLRSPLGRTRLLRIDGDMATVPRIDSSYYALHHAH